MPACHCLTLPALLFSSVETHYRFGLAFGESPAGSNGVIGNPAQLGGLMFGVGAAPLTDLAATIPMTVFFVFQLMFAVITPALIIGSIADR
jgi:Amt family ammonium transporter